MTSILSSQKAPNGVAHNEDSSSEPSSHSPSSHSVALSEKDSGIEADLPDDASSASGSLSAYQAPLGDAFSEISIDARSIVSNGESDNMRPESLEDLSEQDKEDALRIKKEANKSFQSSDYSSALDLYTLALNRNPFDSSVWCNSRSLLSSRKVSWLREAIGAAVRLKREEFGLAISDASEFSAQTCTLIMFHCLIYCLCTAKAIELDAKYIKAYYRRAVAALAIMNPKSAIDDFKKVVQLDPQSANARAQLDSTMKLQKRLAFEKAIASKESEAVSVTIRKQIDDGMTMEKDYDGPILEEVKGSDGKTKAKITQTFIDQMLEHFKKRKLLSRLAQVHIQHHGLLARAQPLGRKYVWQIALGCQAELLKHETMVEIDIPEGQTCDVIGVRSSVSHVDRFSSYNPMTLQGHSRPIL